MAVDYTAPEAPTLVPAGQGGRVAINLVVKGLVKAGKISHHDALVAGKLAHVLTGGDLAKGGQPLSEQDFLDLEREAFVSLAGEPMSQARMAHMLKTGKPLRN